MVIFTEKITDEKHLVQMVHFKPELLRLEEKAKGYEVPSIPEPERRKGFIETLYYDPITQELFYEYIEAPAPPEDEFTY